MMSLNHSCSSSLFKNFYVQLFKVETNCNSVQYHGDCYLIMYGIDGTSIR